VNTVAERHSISENKVLKINKNKLALNSDNYVLVIVFKNGLLQILD